MNKATAAASTLFLGQNGETWDFWLMLSVVFVAPLAAAIIGITTAGSIMAHKREAAQSVLDLEQYKAQADGKTSDAAKAASDAAAKAFAAGIAAGAAQTDADIARSETAKAHARAEDARAKAADANLAAAKANERAAKLEASNLDLQAKIAPRRLSGFISPDLMKVVKGRTIRVLSYGGDVESGVLASQIVSLCQQLKANVEDLISSQSSLGQFGVGVRVTGRDAALELALSSYFRSFGIAVHNEPMPTPMMSMGGAGTGEPDLTVFVGPKPPN